MRRIKLEDLGLFLLKKKNQTTTSLKKEAISPTAVQTQEPRKKES